MKNFTLLMVVTLAATASSLAIDIATPLSAVTEAYHTGDLAKAEQLANRHVTYDSHSIDSRFVAARILVSRGKCNDAIPLLLANVKEAPGDFRSWQLLGECRIQLGKLDEGVLCLKKALELNAYYGPSYLWLAKATADKKAQSELLQKVLVMEERDTPTAKEALRMLDSQRKDK